MISPRILGLLTLTAAAALAGPVVIDGVFSSAEWGAPVKHLTPYVDGSGLPQQSVDLYWWTDAQRVYGAVVGDPSLPYAFDTANVYVYSSSASLRPNGTVGTYGDGDDIIIESGDKWHFSLNGPTLWAGPDHLLPMVVTGAIHTGSDGLISLAYDTSTLVTEFSIDRSLLGAYDKYRFGGQLYAYEFNTGSGDREAGALVDSTPEPSTMLLLGGGLIVLLRKRCAKVFVVALALWSGYGALPAAAGVIDVFPSSPGLADTAGSVVGNTQSAPGFGNGSWQATGVKSNFYISPQDLFGHSVLIGDVASISYWTNQANYSGGANWSLYIYTVNSGAGDAASWFRSRLFAYPGAGAAGWDQWTTAGLDFVDTVRGGGSASSSLLWAPITVGPVTLMNGTTWNYSGETVQSFSLQTDSGANNFTGLVDGLTIRLKNGESASVNFETPEPGTLGLLAIGLAMVIAGKRG